jgi:hypothetical protein
MIRGLPKLRRLGIRICAARQYTGPEGVHGGKLQWLLEDLTAAFELDQLWQSSNPRVGPDGAELWFWDAKEGEVLSDKEG